MAQADIQKTVEIERAKLFTAITKYEDYPKFVDGCTKVEVERKGPGHARVTYHVSMMKEVSYTLDHVEDAASGRVEWKLVKSDSLKGNTGRWLLKDAGKGRTEVKYEIDIDFSFPVPGFILSKLVKGSLPSMIESFVKQARKV
jgi:ribosome-associated toxin RatA of RatAB toxin-antitoxin module